MRLAAEAGGRRLAALAALCVVALALAAPSQAPAFRPLLSGKLLRVIQEPQPFPPPEGQIEGACGLAVAPGGGDIYVSDFFHRAVDVFSSEGIYKSQIPLPGGPFTGVGTNTLDGVCGLALDSAGNLYANEWHRRALRLKPTEFVLAAGEATAVALDAARNVYVDERTYVAVYQPSGAPVLDEGQPLKIGLGSLGDAYGIAVSGGRVYAADAASNSVKVFEPATDPDAPVATISHDFTSLVDSALAVDPTNGNLLVLDNLQPGFTFPEAAVEEFAADGTFLGMSKGTPTSGPIVDGGPSGLAVDSAGNLYVTSGNSEGSNVFKFGPYSTGASLSALSAPAPAGPSTAAAATAPPGPAAATATSRSPRPVAGASEVSQHGGVRVAVQAKLTPKKLPRTRPAPVHFSLSARIGVAGEAFPPQLRRIEVEINRNGQVNTAGLPVCKMDQIQPSTTQGALQACRSALVGEGTFSAKVLLTQQAPFPSDGEVVAFNGRWNGKPAILAHIYGTKPVPTSYTLPFTIAKVAKGTYGTALKASLPQFTSKWGYVTGISLFLGRSTSRGGYLTAACRAPKGFSAASFPLARAKLSFGGAAKAVQQTLTRSCGVR